MENSIGACERHATEVKLNTVTESLLVEKMSTDRPPWPWGFTAEVQYTYGMSRYRIHDVSACVA